MTDLDEALAAVAAFTLLPTRASCTELEELIWQVRLSIRHDPQSVPAVPVIRVEDLTLSDLDL